MRHSLFHFTALLSSSRASSVVPANGQSVSWLSSQFTETLNSIKTHGLIPDDSRHVLGLLKQTPSNAIPTSLDTAYNRLTAVYQSSPAPRNLFAAAGAVLAAGLTSSKVAGVLNQDTPDGPNSISNTNPRAPSRKIFPSASFIDAPYSISEQSLRQAIHIPSTFQYGASESPQPIILVPGTGNTGFQTFRGNLIPLLQNSSIADPVWLNIPDQLLGDIQVNAEYVAYAIHYISAISNNRKIAIASWSQGGIACQWAYKYWPSARSLVTDQIAFSPDYKGTILADRDEGSNTPSPPAALQQGSKSNFIRTLRAGGGDAALVATTTIYSSFFDEVVQPQKGTNASAFLKSGAITQASNNEVQVVCKGRPAGGFYLHEGTLINNLGFELLKDALVHDGPGQASRLNLSDVCSPIITKGLDLKDFLLTEDALLISGISMLGFSKTVSVEPTIKGQSIQYQITLSSGSRFSLTVNDRICAALRGSILGSLP